jgi:hypothetical protein
VPSGLVAVSIDSEKMQHVNVHAFRAASLIAQWRAVVQMYPQLDLDPDASVDELLASMADTATSDSSDDPAEAARDLVRVADMTLVCCCR